MWGAVGGSAGSAGALVEGQGGHRARLGLVLDEELELRAGRRELVANVCRRDIRVQRRRHVARTDVPDLLAGAGDLVALARAALARRHQADQPPAGAALLLQPFERLAADEVVRELDRPVEAGLERVRRLVDLVTVERHAGLVPQRVARA